jgi:hypothetical protein
MTDLFGQLVEGINPAADTETEWFSVPLKHSYTGTIRAAHTGSAGTGPTKYNLAVVSSSGVSPTKANWQPFGVELEEGGMYDITYEIGPGKAVVVEADSNNVSFNFSGLDIDNT